MSGSKPVLLKLKTPITHGSEEIKELTVRRPTAGEIRDLSLPPKNAGEILDIAVHCTGHPPSVINKLDGSDAMALMRIVSGFLAPGQ